VDYVGHFSAEATAKAAVAYYFADDAAWRTYTLQSKYSKSDSKDGCSADQDDEFIFGRNSSSSGRPLFTTAHRPQGASDVER
jgi:hypothetical protein